MFPNISRNLEAFSNALLDNNQEARLKDGLAELVGPQSAGESFASAGRRMVQILPDKFVASTASILGIVISGDLSELRRENYGIGGTFVNGVVTPVVTLGWDIVEAVPQAALALAQTVKGIGTLVAGSSAD